ncbi:Y-family DNA polymerase [Pseudoalteromonas sp. C2R02]|uniref:Y-family DNA polymerase n=1 Tax=Pseudoalteromonas sp. C2R02 TaxID=2841565 RepID=UPI001C09144B|nr:Y-family DNA polymerase [Pseudoalteromonas sp. C2R02]MBU2970807.1 Y-family DNA polymerase [Pseudoalteromonas sp. C2R02]
MFALVDAVSFYASAEKVFDPAIRSKPVVVLTNNDGCICAICPIARKFNIPKFQPYFKVKDYLAKHNVVIRSSNYELYADLSEKMMNVIGRYCDNQYVYSIDESFLQFTGFKHLIDDWHEYGHQIRSAVWRETKLPVGVGFGTTPTLAKAANHAAKKLSGYNGVAIIDTESSRKEILAKMTVTDVWGIGRRLGRKLQLMNINTALDLSNCNARDMGRLFSVLVERTISELNGIQCLSWDEIKQAKKEIFSTRSFGKRIEDRDSLVSALTAHSTIVAKKLRQQNSLTKRIVIFAASSPHEAHYYKKSFLYDFPVATADTCVLAHAVSTVLPTLFKPGIRFYRCGVGAIDLETAQFKQSDMFNTSQDKPELMVCFDKINHRFGQGTLQLASEKSTEQWQMKRHFLSPHFTSCWQDIPKIRC